MFSKDEFVFYGTAGVCRVEDICHSPFDKADTRLFYVLKPVSCVGNETIYTPVEGMSRMRPLMSKERAEELLFGGNQLGPLEIPTDKQRRDTYKTALLSGEPQEYARLLNTVQRRRADALLQKRHLPDMDVDYESRAEKCLFSELSIVLGKTASEVSDAFFGKIAE